MLKLLLKLFSEKKKKQTTNFSVRGASNLGLHFIHIGIVNLIGMEGDLGTLKSVGSKRLCSSTEQVEHEELQASAPLLPSANKPHPWTWPPQEAKPRS